MINPFYMVFLEGCDTPAYKHNSIESAQLEAERLCLLHNRKAYVLCTIKSIEKIKPFAIQDMRPQGEDLPF